MRRHIAGWLALLATISAAGACGERADASPPAAGAAAGGKAPVHIDSILPIDEEIRRFRARVGRSVDGLTGSEATRDALVLRFVAALEAADTATLASLALDPAEFIDLYYPHTMYTARPYELSPSVVWTLQAGNSEKGLVRLLRRYAGRPLGYRAYQCDAEPSREGPNRIHDGCIVEIAAAGAGPVRLFGSIIERDGRFAFVSWANDL